MAILFFIVRFYKSCYIYLFFKGQKKSFVTSTEGLIVYDPLTEDFQTVL
jgi:hypothetical protein